MALPRIHWQPSRGGGWVLANAALAILDFAASRLGLVMPTVGGTVSPLWPPSGVAIAATILLGYRALPGIALGAAVAEVVANAHVGGLTAGTLAISVWQALGHAGEAAAAAWLVHRFADGRDCLRSPKGVARYFLLAGLLAPWVSAAVGVTGLYLHGTIPAADFPATALTWWVGDAAGAFLLAPLAIVWLQPTRLPPTKAWHWALTMGAAASTSLAVFGGAFLVEVLRPFFVMPVLVTAAFYLGQRGAFTVSAVVGAIAVWATARGIGPFATEPGAVALVSLEAFLAVGVVTAALVAAVVSQRQAGTQALADLTQLLESRVAERTTELQTATQVLETTFETVPLVLALSEPATGKLVRVNQAFETTFRTPRARAIGQTTTGLRFYGDDPGERQRLVKANQEGGANGIDFVLHRPDGTSFPAKMWSRSLLVGGRPLFLTCALDMTNEERALALQRETAALLESLVESIPVSVAVSDARSGELLRVNQGFEELFGMPRSHAVGKTGVALGLYARPEDRQPLMAALQRDGFVAGLAMEFQGSGQRRIEARVWSRPIQYLGHDALLSVTMDVTAHNAAEREAQRARAEADAANAERARLEVLAEADRLKSDFINLAAHELNTPLTPIRLHLRALRASSAAGGALDAVERNVKRIDELVQNIIDITRLQGGNVVLQPVLLDAGRDARRLAAAHAKPAADAGVVLECEAQDGAWVTVDAARFSQVVGHLVDNAVKFTPPGGTVRVRVQASGPEVAVAVTDTGIGLSREDLERLFKPFTQFHPDAQTSKARGSGLGLYICQQVIELQGGRLSAQSPGKGKGATFTWTLPRASGSAPPPP